MDRSIILFAHNIRSMWNVGSFFRTCDAFAVEKIYLTGYTAFPPRKEISKTAIGAEEHVAWEHHENPILALESLKSDGWSLVALELTPDSKQLPSFKPKKKTCLIVGHELTGVPEDILSLCDDVVAIGMLGHKESLNVAVAAGVALHHLRFS